MGTASEYQWKAKLTGLTPNVKYCYRIFFGTTSIDLLGGDPSPQFWSALPAGSNQSYSFAVFGDWGDTDQQGNNPQQAALDASLGASGVRFALAHRRYRLRQREPAELRRPQPDGLPRELDLRAELLAAGGRLGPAVQRAREPRRERDVLHELAAGAGGRHSSGKYQMETYCCANNSKSASVTEHVVRVQRGERTVLRVDRRNGAIPTSATPPRTGWTTRTAGSRTAPSTSG